MRKFFNKNNIAFILSTSIMLSAIGSTIYWYTDRPIVVDASDYHQTDALIKCYIDDDYITVDESIEQTLSDEEIELIALITMAEAEGECEKGKRLVIDTILNRVDSRYFPDTVSDVIYQPYQFESLYNGRVDRCYVMNDICQLVKEELKLRTNSEVVFFTAGDYGKYGTPMFKVGNHYFCKY